MDPLTISGLIFTAGTAASLIALHASKVFVPRVGLWESPPDVLVSRSANVTRAQVKVAVDWWRDKGFAFGKVVLTDAITGPIKGAIFIGPPDRHWEDGMGGRAKWSTVWEQNDFDDKDEDEMDAISEADKAAYSRVEHVIELAGKPGGKIEHAVITVAPLMPEWDEAEVLKHELGHALGFMHVETSLFGYRKKDSKSGKRKAGDARRFLGIKVIGRKTGHVMNPLLSMMGDSTKGISPE